MFIFCKVCWDLVEFIRFVFRLLFLVFLYFVFVMFFFFICVMKCFLFIIIEKLEIKVVFGRWMINLVLWLLGDLFCNLFVISVFVKCEDIFDVISKFKGINFVLCIFLCFWFKCLLRFVVKIFVFEFCINLRRILRKMMYKVIFLICFWVFGSLLWNWFYFKM